MRKNQISLKEILPTVLIMGIIGVVLLIGTELLISNHLFLHKGWWIILTYAIAMFATMFVLRANKNIEMNYLKSFVTGVMTFMLMTLILDLYFCIQLNNVIPLWGHSLRFMAMFGFALASSAIVALFFRKRKVMKQ